jgi:hypothetical protein
MTKTSIHLKHGTNIWPLIEAWAGENHYVLENAGDTKRVYLRKSADAGAEIRVAISQSDGIVHIEAWYSDLLRKELAIDSNSLYAALPRKEASAEIQKLLTALGAAPSDKTKTKKKANIAFNLGRSIRKLSGKK